MREFSFMNTVHDTNKEASMTSVNPSSRGSSEGSGRGFASMDRESQREIASKGGRASHGGGRKSSGSQGKKKSRSGGGGGRGKGR
jgi:hypothetical protein